MEHLHGTHLRAVEKSLCACCESLGKDNHLCSARIFGRGDSDEIDPDGMTLVRVKGE
jgi:hypothetical protein